MVQGASRRVQRPRPWSIVLAALTCALGCGAVDAELGATLSAAKVLPGQPVVLTLTQTGPAGVAPSLEPLRQDFQVTNRASSSEVSVVNGKRRERRELRLTLLPRRTGTLTVPALRAGNEATRPIKLVVGPATAVGSTLLRAPDGVATAQPEVLPPLSIEVAARVEPRRARVRQQVVLAAQVSSSNAPPSGRLHGPRMVGARLLPLGEERRTETLNGHARYLYEQRFAIFPTEPGTLEIPPLQFDAWRITGGSPVSFFSDALAVTVDPAVAPPADNSGNSGWLPARMLSLAEAGPPAVRIAPGQTLERMITLRGDGVMAEDLPAIPLQIPFQLRIRDDAPRLWNERTPAGVIGYRSERILIGTAEDGVYTLPGAVLDWWNTATQGWEQARLPAWTLTVAAFASEDRRPAATWHQGLAAPGDTAGGLSAPRRAAASAPPVSFGEAWQPWLWITGAIVAPVLLAILVARRRRAQSRAASRPGTDQHAGAPPVPERADAQVAEQANDVAVARVEQAYRRGDAAAARQALLDWGRLVWPRAVPANLSQLALRLEPPLRDEIRLLEKAFFSPVPIDWTQAPVWERLGPAADRERERERAAQIANAEMQTSQGPGAS